MSEPILTEQKNETGRPSITEEQFQAWLNELRPHLELSNSLYRACLKAKLENHYDTILKKYNLKDWFFKKCEGYKAQPGETINEVFVKLINLIADKVNEGKSLEKTDIDILKHFSEKHRTAQPFFVSRQEIAQTMTGEDKIGQILDELERQNEKDQYKHIAEEAGKSFGVKSPNQDANASD